MFVRVALVWHIYMRANMEQGGQTQQGAQKSEDANCCQLTLDEIRLQKLKLIILAILCAILGTFLVAFKVQYITQKLESLQVSYDNATAITRTLEANLTDITQTLDILKVSYANATAMKEILERNLREEITKLEKELKDLQEEALKNCTAGWEYFSGKCYYSSTDMKNWAESRDACVTMGGHLVIIETQEEQDFLTHHNPAQNQDYWIGLTDSAKEGEWRWVDNSLLKNNAKYWWRTEPDNWKGDAARPLPEGEDCAKVDVRRVRNSSMQLDDVTYSDVTFVKKEDGGQKQAECDGEDAKVIYSEVNVPKQSPANPNPADSSPTPHPEKGSHTCVSLRCTVLLLCLSLLLLLTAVAMAVLYISKGDTNSDIKENLEKLRAENENITIEKRAVESQLSGVQQQLETLKVEHARVTQDLVANLSDITQKLDSLQVSYYNATAITRTLEANLTDITQTLDILKVSYANATAMTEILERNLTETQRILAGQMSTNDNLTKEITKLEKELKDLQKEALKNCTAGWEYFSGKCYYFSTDMKNWAESRDACVTMGGHLVIIETQEEQDFLTHHNLAQNQQYWIGLTDSAKEGEWRWVDNSLLKNNAKYWSGTEPDDWKGTSARPLPNGEDCAKMDLNGVRNSWYDGSCEESKKRICESKAK
ncbi:hypothetical protein ACEWY4_024978 [Coilia grayii]|uniref:C-type lectin domain-containing protein n=1 Tax=Coilia grayii TaxID=363190 RepID=A0ABD1IWG9_9TELE